MIVIDFVDHIAGSHILKQMKEVIKVKNLVEVMDPWEKDFDRFKNRNVDVDFIKYPWALFNRLGELDFNQLEKE
jgi:hypothetical protein